MIKIAEEFNFGVLLYKDSGWSVERLFCAKEVAEREYNIFINSHQKARIIVLAPLETKTIVKTEEN